MSSLSLEQSLRWRSASLADIDAMLAIEQRAYSHPWTRGNFVDSIVGGHWAWCATAEGSSEGDALCAYWLAMPVVDELHLLNLAVDPRLWAQGFGRRTLEHLHLTASALGFLDVWLEVRESNARAQRLYQAAGYDVVGRRRAYYPADSGREDALLMRRGGVR